MYEMELQIRSLPTEELLRMVREDANEYTEEALSIAVDELTQRNIPWDTPSADPAQTGLDARTGSGGNAIPCARQGGFRDLLAQEMQYEESYHAVRDFVESMNIRNGEYEGMRLVVRKMDHENFILYTESEQDGLRVITGCAAVAKRELVVWMEEVGVEKGFEGEEETEDVY